jgi:hypothetical protein
METFFGVRKKVMDLLNDLYEETVCPACFQTREPPTIDNQHYLEYLDKAWDQFGALSLPVCESCYHSENCLVNETNGIPYGFLETPAPQQGPFSKFQRIMLYRLLRGRTFVEEEQ